MTVDEIVARLRTQPLTPLRAQKLVALCQRMRVDLDAVLAQLTPEEQAVVKEQG